MNCKKKMRVARIILILILISLSNENKKTSIKKEIIENQKFEGFNQIKLKFSNIGTKKIFNDINNIFPNKIKIFLDNNSNRDITSQCQKNQIVIYPNIVTCNIITTNIILQLNSDIVNLTQLFYKTDAFEIFFEESWKNTYIRQMQKMCDYAEKLISIDISNLNTEKLINIDYIFRRCTKLTSINFGTINLSKINDFSNIFEKSTNLIFCKFYKYDNTKSNLYKYCPIFIGFQHCPKCENLNHDEYCIITIDSRPLKFLYLSSETEIMEHSEKQCYYFKYVDNYKDKFLHPNNIIGKIKCNIEGKQNTTLCKKCNNLLHFYQLETDFEKQEFDCYDYNIFDKNIYYINENNLISMCDISCKGCYKNKYNCTNGCNSNFYNLIDDKNHCYNETTKPYGYYFNSTKSVFEFFDCEKCNTNDISINCLNCINKNKKLKKINRIIQQITKNDKCLRYDNYYDESNLCLECNEDNDFYSLEEEKNLKYKNCYKKNTKISQHYFNENTKTFKKCYTTCEECENEGDDITHNCKKCIENYIDYGNDSNCILKCPYYHYLSQNGCQNYMCTEYFICPAEVSLTIYPKKKCVKSCKEDDEYKYQYNSYCLLLCPKDTTPNNEFICIDKNQECKIANDNIYLNFEDLIEENVKILAMNYGKEFKYTMNHISIFNNDDYKVTIYRNYDCLSNSNITRINLNGCSKDKINKIIIVVINVYRTNNQVMVYSIYNATTYEKLSISEICENGIVEEKNVMELLNSNSKIIDFLLEQGINIFDKSGPFFNDICFHFESPNGKDVPLKDRFKAYYPNISLCDDGCEVNGINFTTKTATCKCKADDNLLNNIANNPFLDIDLDLIDESNIEVLKCYHDFFDQKYIKKNIGFFLSLTFIFFQVICTILLIKYGFFGLKIMIYEIITKFNNLIKNKKLNKNKKNILNEPPKKKDSMQSLKGGKSINASINRNNKKFCSSNNIISNQKVFIDCSDKNVSKQKINSVTSLALVEEEKEKIKKKQKQKISKEKPEKNNKVISLSDSEINTIIEESYDDMDFSNSLLKDNRTFCEMFTDKIKDNLDFVNVFIENQLIPRTIRIILLIIKIDFYFVINGLMYNEEYISQLFNSKEKETFFGFLTRSYKRIIYTSMIGVVIEFLIDWLFPHEKEIKLILLTSDQNNNIIVSDLVQLLNKIKRNYIIFIIISFIITIFSWYYMTCFNNVYPNTKYEWIKSSITIVIFMQIISVCSSFIYSLFRCLSRKWKVERFFKISQNFN